MNKIFTIIAIGVSSLYSSQVFNPERIKEDNLSKEQNYSNSLSWASIENKEIRFKKITTSENLPVYSKDKLIDLFHSRIKSNRFLLYLHHHNSTQVFY